MKKRKLILILTAALAIGIVSPTAAYAAGSRICAEQKCENPGVCDSCAAADCKDCTLKDCPQCGGKVEKGICSECGKEVCPHHQVSGNPNTGSGGYGQGHGQGHGQGLGHGQGHGDGHGSRHC